MISTRILGFLAAFAAAVSAAPVVNELAADAVDYNVTDFGDRDLRNGEMLVYGLDGRSKSSYLSKDTENSTYTR